MRLAQNLSPMQPSMARLPMKSDSGDKTLTCMACHSSHRFDTQTAAMEACLSCHGDEHTLAYETSPHYRLWQNEISGNLPAGSGVSCATCHLPREIHHGNQEQVRVQHNQNWNLRPNEKMIRGVCMNCHSLAFSIDALADEQLIKTNFTGRSSKHILSQEMAVDRINP